MQSGILFLYGISFWHEGVDFIESQKCIKWKMSFAKTEKYEANENIIIYLFSGLCSCYAAVGRNEMVWKIYTLLSSSIQNIRMVMLWVQIQIIYRNKRVLHLQVLLYHQETDSLKKNIFSW